MTGYDCVGIAILGVGAFLSENQISLPVRQEDIKTTPRETILAASRDPSTTAVLVTVFGGVAKAAPQFHREIVDNFTTGYDCVGIAILEVAAFLSENQISLPVQQEEIKQHLVKRFLPPVVIPPLQSFW
ncbi:unnamed protein product [Calypogeia fissa]